MFGVVARGLHKEPGSMLYAGGRQLGTAKKKKERKKRKKKREKKKESGQICASHKRFFQQLRGL